MTKLKSTSKVVGVVGSDGFLGQSLVGVLRDAGHTVHTYDLFPKSAQTSHIDVTDMKSLRGMVASDFLVVLAAEHRDDVRPPSRYTEVNVGGAQNICLAAEELGIRHIIFTSSVAVYGFAPPNTSERGDINYFNEYGRTKYLAENVFRAWFSEDDDKRSLTIIRPTVIFGPGNRGNVYNLIKQIATKRFLMFGDGENIKSIAYVENVASFLSYSLTFAEGLQVFNYVDKPDLNMNQLVNIIRLELFGRSGTAWRMPAVLGIALGYLFDALSFLLRRPLPISSIRVKKFMSTTQFSSLTDNSGFVAPFSLDSALRKTIRHEFIMTSSDPAKSSDD